MSRPTLRPRSSTPGAGDTLKIRRRWGVIGWLGWVMAVWGLQAAAESEAGVGPGDAIFGKPTLVRCVVELTPQSLSALRSRPREYARARVTLDGVVLEDVGIRLKGAAGSYREVDDRPALTVKFNRYVPSGRWHGMRQVHLNNSVQDSTWLSEYLAGELFRAVGVPATRVAWARVVLNGRDLGTYVLKESFEAQFLRRSFGNSDGNLYDGGFLQDIDQDIERDRGTGPLTRSDLKALVRAARERDPRERWRRLRSNLDVDRFVSYAVVSAMIADWDGYAMNRNNYRVYFDPRDGKAVFLPHGTDQLFERNEIGMEPEWGGLVARSLFSLPEARQMYRERFVQVFTNQFTVAAMTERIERVVAGLKTELPGMAGRARWATQTVRNRIRSLGREPELRGLMPPPEGGLRVPAEGYRPDEWTPQASGRARFEETESEGTTVLCITSAGSEASSYRAPVRLPGGRYRFEGRVRTMGVAASSDRKGEGAGLRISGSVQPRGNSVSGDRGWTPVAYEFEVAGEEGEVVLVVELRASRGRAEFDRGSLRVVPMGR